jgi:hypothetical protein
VLKSAGVEAWAQNTDERNAALNARGALMDANDDLKRLPWSALDDLDGLRARGGAYAEWPTWWIGNGRRWRARPS